MQERLPKTYCPIKNSIAEALGRHRLSAYESSILWVVIRKTYGWTTKAGTRKTEDWISLSQLSEATGIPISHTSRTIKLLILRRIITQRGKFLGVNKHTEDWLDLGRKDLQAGKLPKGVKEVTQRGKFLLPKGVSTKESKESTKEIEPTEQAPAIVDKSVNKPKDNLEVKEAMDKVLETGFNIYAAVYKAKAQMHQTKDWHFPDPVILRVCEAYHKEKTQIKEQWPWFLSVLRRESETWHAEQNVAQGQKFKKEWTSLEEILRKAGSKT